MRAHGIEHLPIEDLCIENLFILDDRPLACVHMD